MTTTSPKMETLLPLSQIVKLLNAGAAALTDEDIRLDCIKAASRIIAENGAHDPHSGTKMPLGKATVDLATRFEEYVKFGADG